MIHSETPLRAPTSSSSRSVATIAASLRGSFCAKSSPDSLSAASCRRTTHLAADEGTLRGMHYQLQPEAETKLVRCIRGAPYDIILDLRDGSPTFGKYSESS